MTTRIDEIMALIHHLENDLQEELSRHNSHLKSDFEEKRMRFEREVVEQQKRFKMGLVKYLWTANFRSFISIPFIYSLIVPFLFLDLLVSIYQFVCFPLFGIEKVRRRDHIVFDRAHLAYLNLFEKINCAYCSYANGLISYIREIAGKTEQYWCPIKHAKRLYFSHPYYKNFTEYGEADLYQKELEILRKKLKATK
jgi:hypothetical protein